MTAVWPLGTNIRMFSQLEALERQADREAVAFRDQFKEHRNTLSRANELIQHLRKARNTIHAQTVMNSHLKNKLLECQNTLSQLFDDVFSDPDDSPPGDDRPRGTHAYWSSFHRNDLNRTETS